jgi:sec-independent protein translocase protein TatC
VHRQYNEDLFDHTKMTFGEHLDDLRRSLLKAMLALVVGVLVGLLVANKVIDYVQNPLREALRNYYSNMEGRKQFNLYIQDLTARGRALPTDMKAAEQAFVDRGLVLEEHYIDPAQLAEVLKSIAPDSVNASSLPTRRIGEVPQANDLVPLVTYHRVEDDPRVRIIGLRVEEGFLIYMKAALVVGATVASPFIFYFIWQFVAAGLYPHEQRYVHIFLPFSIGLFLAGAALAFFVVFRFVLAFLLSFYEWMGIDPDARISDWLTFVLIMPLGFGVSFQLPLVMLFLERIGIFSVKNYLSNWRISVLVICFIAMILTPSDPYSMMLMAAPLVALFFFGILLCHWMPRRTTPFGELIE